MSNENECEYLDKREVKNTMSGARKIIVIYSQSDLGRDPRVHRQIELFSKHYDIIAFGKRPPQVKVKKFFDISYLIGIPEEKQVSFNFIISYIKKFGLATFFSVGFMSLMEKVPAFYTLKNYWMTYVVRGKVLRRLKGVKCELIIANDLSGLAVCAAAKGNRKLYYDAHEYSPGQFARSRKNLGKRMLARYCLSKYLKCCDVVTTIGYGIADLYFRRFNCPCTVITNAPSYRELKPFCRNDNKIKLVHHGLAAKRRGIEAMIDVMKFLDDRFTLDFYLVFHDPEYYGDLKRYASNDPRITFNKPVPMQTLPEVLNHYDVGFRFYPPNTINMKHGLPNKFFEFIQARLAVAVGPTPEAMRYIEKYGFGIVSPDFNPKSMAKIFMDLTPSDIMKYKEKADEHAYELSASPNSDTMLDKVRSLIGA